MAWYVSKENTIGQVTWDMFESQKKFDEWYAGTMKDGSNDPIKVAYPKIHYQGTDMNECMNITKEKARQNYSHPLTPLIHTIADAGNIEIAEALYNEVRTPQ